MLSVSLRECKELYIALPNSCFKATLWGMVSIISLHQWLVSLSFYYNDSLPYYLTFYVTLFKRDTSRTAPSLTTNSMILVILLCTGIKRLEHFYHSLISFEGGFERTEAPFPCGLSPMGMQAPLFPPALCITIFLLLFYLKWVNYGSF